METKTEMENISDRANEVATGKIGNETIKNVEETAQRESPLDEVRRLNKDTKEMLSKIADLRKEMEMLNTYNILAGRGDFIQKKEVTPEELKKTKVDELATKYTSIFK